MVDVEVRWWWFRVTIATSALLRLTGVELQWTRAGACLTEVRSPGTFPHWSMDQSIAARANLSFIR